jgi:hypothetical protein
MRLFVSVVNHRPPAGELRQTRALSLEMSPAQDLNGFTLPPGRLLNLVTRDPGNGKVSVSWPIEPHNFQFQLTDEQLKAINLDRDRDGRSNEDFYVSLQS